MSVKDLPSIDRLSVSQVNMILRCPMQWWFRYALGRKQKPSRAMTGGSCLDEIVNEHNFNRIAGRPVDTYLRDKVVADWEERVEKIRLGEGFDEKDDDDYAYREKLPLAWDAYMTQADPHIQPTHAQLELAGHFGGVPTLGYIDIEEPGITTDLKFGKRKYEAAKMLQLHTYRAMGIEEGREGRIVRACTVLKNKTPVVKWSSYEVTDRDINFAKRSFQEAWFLTRTALRQGTPVLMRMADSRDQRGPWPCSERWCGYYKSCRGSEAGVPDLAALSIAQGGEA
jgi:hypothetical protein